MHALYSRGIWAGASDCQQIAHHGPVPAVMQAATWRGHSPHPALRLFDAQTHTPRALASTRRRQDPQPRHPSPNQQVSSFHHPQAASHSPHPPAPFQINPIPSFHPNLPPPSPPILHSSPRAYLCPFPTFWGTRCIGQQPSSGRRPFQSYSIITGPNPPGRPGQRHAGVHARTSCTCWSTKRWAH